MALKICDAWLTKLLVFFFVKACFITLRCIISQRKDHVVVLKSGEKRLLNLIGLIKVRVS